MSGMSKILSPRKKGDLPLINRALLLFHKGSRRTSDALKDPKSERSRKKCFKVEPLMEGKEPVAKTREREQSCFMMEGGRRSKGESWLDWHPCLFHAF